MLDEREQRFVLHGMSERAVENLGDEECYTTARIVDGKGLGDIGGSTFTELSQAGVVAKNRLDMDVGERFEERLGALFFLAVQAIDEKLHPSV